MVACNENKTVISNSDISSFSIPNGNRRIPDGKTIYGVYKGVLVGVKRTRGKIGTVFPDSDQSSVLKKGENKMDTQRLRVIIEKSSSLHPNDDFGFEECCKQLTEILTQNITETISFFENDCTDEEFYWLGAVLEDIAEKTQSEEFIAALRRRLSKVKPENYCQQNFISEHMKKWVDYAEYIRSVGIDIDYAEGRIDNP